MIIDIDGWYYRARRLFCYAEKEFWHATPRKVIAEFQKYCEWNGIGKAVEEPEEICTLDDVLGVT